MCCLVVQKYHTLDGRRCEVKKALSKMEMRNLKGDVGFQNTCNVWPAGSHCGSGNGSGNGCTVGRNFAPSCHTSGYGPGCSGMSGFAGPQVSNIGNYGSSNAINHGGWST